jgi:hypothetical protein
MIRLTGRVIASAVFFLGLWGCSFAPFDASGGSGTDVETRVQGSVVDSSGKPIAGASVLLRPSGYVFPVLYNPSGTSGERIDAITDISGNFRIDSVDSGSYVIEINNRCGFAAAVRFVTPDSGGIKDLGIATVVRTGVVFGTIPAELRAGKQWYIQVYGLERIATADFENGAYSFSDIPAGSYSLRLMTTSPDIEPIDSCNVAVPSGDTVVAPTYPLWEFSRKLTLNTTATGASLTSDIAAFPVLVRLKSDIIDFSQAAPDGSDLRFTKADGIPLHFEIEQWDVTNERAAIWVSMDTIYGNSNVQHIVMVWGNSKAAAQSNSVAVFDTANGFQGVWHLDQPAGGMIRDATGNGNSGTAAATTTVSGTIGMAQSFNGLSSVIQASGPANGTLNFPENGSYSVSAWVNAATVDSLYRGIVYKSNFQYGLQIRPENKWEFFTFVNGTGWEGSRTPVTTGSWHFVTGVRRGNLQYLFLDGTCVDSAKVVVASNLSRVSDSPLEIGHCPDGGLEPDRYFSGVIDEVRISRTANSADWIKLCYMNQKAEDALVHW